VCKKTLLPHGARQRNTVRNKKAAASDCSLVVAQKPPHPHKESKTKQQTPPIINCNQPQLAHNATETQTQKQTPQPKPLVVVEKRVVHSNN